MLDLNTLIPAGSGLQLTNAFNINDRGEILAKSVPIGTTPVDDEDLGHVVLLVPCEEGDDCESEDSNTVSSTLTNQPAPRGAPSLRTQLPKTAKDVATEWRAKIARQYRFTPVAPKP
jgi:hypothetical protein